MIVILEGVNGVGKSTYAKLLHAELKLPVWRPFRRTGDIHWGHTSDDVSDNLVKAGVPINTFVDDLYCADALAVLNNEGAILDRALPSSLAYGTLHGEDWIKAGMIDWVWKYWEQTLVGSGHSLLWVHLSCQRAVSKARCGDRWHPNKTDWVKLERMYGKAQQMTNLPILGINTEHKTPEAGVRLILEHLDHA